MHTEEKNIYLVIVITCLLSALLLIYFFISILKFHKKDLKEKLETIYGKNGILEEEKKRVGREIHDGVSSSLAGVKLMIESVQGLTERDTVRITQVSTNLDSSLKNLRFIMNDLMEINLKSRTLPELLKEYIDRNNMQALSQKLQIEYQINFLFEFTYEKALHIYRIFQEVITNAYKHSNATMLKIQVTESASLIEFIFKDNGDGFNSGQLMLSNAGIGLNNIIFRTEMLEGKHSINSEKNKGTEIILKIPK